jgi:DNA mismatch endonuclease (patch repair protein)
MADVVSRETRSRMMSGIRSKDTKPELLIRQGLHRRGLRFRLHDKRLPGRPDLFFPRYSAAIFVDGCFWHGHDCKYFKLPKTNQQFWKTKIDANKSRDLMSRAQLHALGIRTITVWECETRVVPAALEKRLDQIKAWITRPS